MIVRLEAGAIAAAALTGGLGALLQVGSPATSVDWQSVVSVATLAGLVAQGIYLVGTHRELVKTLKRTVEDHEERIRIRELGAPTRQEISDLEVRVERSVERHEIEIRELRSEIRSLRSGRLLFGRAERGEE